MIDLNTAGPQEPVHCDASAYPQFDFPDITARLQSNLWWIEHFFPRGRKSSCKKFWCLADWSGREPSGEGSCRINLRGDRAGWGYDFTTAEGADPIKVIGYAMGLSGIPLFREASRIAGSSVIVPIRAAQPKANDNAQYVEGILAETKALRGTAGESYLASRKIVAPECQDLLFHPDLTDIETKRGYCGLIAIARNGQGERTGGIQRTFLLDDGSGKASVGSNGRKSLGPMKGGSVRLAPIADDGHVGIAEGVETALSVTMIFGVPCWASLGTDGMSSWEWPAEAKRVTIFADARQAGQGAAQTLSRRLGEAGVAHEIRSPIHGDDFNDDLKKGVTSSDYPGAEKRLALVPATTIEAGDLEEIAAKLTQPPDTLQMGQALAMLVRAKLDPVEEHCYLAKIKKQTGVAIGSLREQVKQLKRKLISDGHQSGPAWLAHLRRDAFGNPERNEANIMTVLENDPAFINAIIFNEFRQEIIVIKPMPWEHAERLPRAWLDVDDIHMAEWLQRRDLNVAPNIVSRAVQAIARKNGTHPVREYLSGLRWDGVSRLDKWTITHLGAADTILNGAFGALWMISAVARIMQPGCKADCAIILEGPQGAKKSSALKALAGGEWFTDELSEVGSKDAAQQIRGVWIIEIAELDAVNKADVSSIKAFLSRSVDRYRPAYERYVIDVPRQCVFAGSVNPDTYLRDETGNRRFWPIRCGVIDLGKIKQDRDQLWAEAVAQFKAGRPWWLVDPILIAAAAEEQDARYQGDAWDERISLWMAVDPSFGIARREPIADVSVGEILQGALGLEPAKWSRMDQMRVSAYLKHNRWVRYQKKMGGKQTWRYRAEE